MRNRVEGVPQRLYPNPTPTPTPSPIPDPILDPVRLLKKDSRRLQEYMDSKYLICDGAWHERGPGVLWGVWYVPSLSAGRYVAPV